MQLINSIIKSGRWRITLLLFVSCLFCAGMIAYRIFYSQTIMYGFIAWNLFLAAIPFVLSSFLLHNKKWNSTLWRFGLVFFFWLLFYPNSAYIITDLVHLKIRQPVPYWYDLTLLFFSSFTGLMLGIISLMDMQLIVSAKVNKVIGWLFSIGILIGSGFGIYVGRYLRWNSWDAILQPHNIIKDFYETFISDGKAFEAFLFTGIFSGVLVLVYLMFKLFDAGKVNHLNFD